MNGWRAIEDVLEEMRQRADEADEALRLRYELGAQAIDKEREERQLTGRMGKLPR